MNFCFDENQSTLLCEIMRKNKSDKGTIYKHNFTTFYYEIFHKMRHHPLRIFELGLGTNNIHLPSSMGPEGRPGASLYGWSEFFPNAQIFGADIDSDILFQSDQIHTFYCDQTNVDSIATLWKEPLLAENFDIILEDGLHNFYANKCFFENSIHKLKPLGYFIIEDITINDMELFENQLMEWKWQYKNCLFQLLPIPCPGNTFDNNLLVVKKMY